MEDQDFLESEQGDNVEDGLRPADELDLAQDREDRLAAESRTETAEDKEGEDASEDRFAYTLSNGEEFEGTFAEITAKEAELLAEAKVAELAKTQKPTEEKTAARVEDTGEIESVQWENVGENFEAMLSEGRAKEVGPALRDVVLRTFATEPFIGGMLLNAVKVVLAQEKSAADTNSSLKEALGDLAGEPEVAALSKLDPESRQAVMNLIATLKGKTAKVEESKTKEVEAAKRTGEQEAVRNLKAKGQLRRISGRGTSTKKTPGEYSPGDENSRLNAWGKRLADAGV